MRETRQSGSEGGEAKCLPYPYHDLRGWCIVSRGLHVGITLCEENDAGSHPCRGLVSTTVAISGLPASRSYTRTGNGAFARMQSCVRTTPLS